MKTITNHFKAFIVLLSFLSAFYANAQMLPASFTHTVNAGGVVNFSCTTVGTSSITSYIWKFGDSLVGFIPPTLNGQPAHTYTANGIYFVQLTVQNGAISNTTAVTQTVVVNTSTNTGCTLIANFTGTAGIFGSYYMTNTSTGTTVATFYSFNFGDGLINSVPAPAYTTNFFSHQYSYNGTFTVSMTTNNNYTPACVSTKTDVVTITTSTCNLIPGFTFTNSGGNTVHFTNTSSYSSPLLTYWNFGDGSAVIAGDTAIHTYAQNGTYTVQQTVIGNSGCTAYMTHQVVITGTSCVANSNFTLSPSGTPKWWNAFPSYPYNVSSAVWNWGDGDTSNTLYTSHIYSVAGTYAVCLTVTITCGDTSSTCSSYMIYKSAGAASEMIGVSVLDPSSTTGIKNITTQNIDFTLYPNPGSGLLNIKTSKNEVVKIEVYDLVGNIIHSEETELLSNKAREINLNKASSGIYFVKITSASKSFTQKIIINK